MKKNKYIPMIIIIIVLLLSSVGLYCVYPNVYQHAKEANYNRSIHSFILEKTQKYNYVIDKTVKNYKDYSQYLQLTGSETDYLKKQKNSLMKDYQSYESELTQEQNLFYYAIDLKTNQTSSNTSDHLKDIESNKELQEKYKYYFQVIFDENGQATVNLMSENFDESFTSYGNDLYLDTYVETDDEGEQEGKLSMSAPKNISIIYAVPQTLTADALDQYMHLYYTNQVLLYMFPYIVIALLVVSITMLIIPFDSIQKNRFFHFISEIKFEILSAIWLLVMYYLSYFILRFIALTSSNDILEFYKFFAIEYMASYLTAIIHIGLWFIFLLLISIFIYMLKYLFHKGIKDYFIENTCICWIYKVLKNFLFKIIHFDFDDSVNKSALRISLLNLAIMFVLCLMFGIFPLFALLYSAIIFIILKKKFDIVQNDYQVLLKATQELSNGHFNFEISEDIGMFNPLKNHFSHIKEGFEKAVNEEVKAQKTKTELISNVSHDLKTPLTSIITYVDLLKDESLSSSQRNEYVKILEKNSLKLKNLIEDLFEVSKANSGDIKLDIVDVDIISMMKQIELEYHDQLTAKKLDIRSHYSHDKIICPLDSSKTYRIFENLFINIYKYALENTRVYIDIVDNDEYVDITFKNISKDEMIFNENEIVERFVQGDKSRNTSGSGLGLAIVKSFTELQKGQFFVQLDGDLFKTIIRFKK